MRPEGKSGGHGVGWSEVPRYSFKVPAGWEETPVSIADLGGTEVRITRVDCHLETIRHIRARSVGGCSIVGPPLCAVATPPLAQIDLRFGDKEQGALQVVVAPVLRFKDVGFNARVTVEELGTPDMLISGFAPELFGTPLNDEDVLETRVINKDGQPYYEWCDRHMMTLIFFLRPCVIPLFFSLVTQCNLINTNIRRNRELSRHRLVSATAVGNRLFLMAVEANGRQWRRAEANLRRIWTSFQVPPA